MDEWEPVVDTRVVDQRRDSRGQAGRVVACDRYGHFADPYWRASVRWDNGSLEHDIETTWLRREEQSQEYPSA